MTVSDNLQKPTLLDRPIFSNVPGLTYELLIFIIIIILMVVSRLYDLGVRVMSHDESIHAFYSWLYSIGQGYQHDPATHGPLQFHLIAFTFLLFGDSDFTARLPAAIASIVTVILLWKWRRYLGRAGMLVAAGLMLISPFMLYYGRYTRNEVFVALLGVVTLYTILRHLETGKYRYLILLTIAAALQFTVKETAFIYTAQALLFLAIYLVVRISRSTWKKSDLLKGFIIGLSIGTLLIGVVIGLSLYNTSASFSGYATVATALISLVALAFIAATVCLILGYGWKPLRQERAFSMLILLGTFVLPQLTAFPVKALGWDPLAYQFTWPGWNFQALWSQGPVRTAAVLFVLIIISMAIGLTWNWKHWLVNAAIFWGIYVFFFSSIFTNWAGLATGVVGSLGYWIVQQEVQRGNQPWYYYLLIQIPIYEFLPALGLVLAAYFGIRRKSPTPLPIETSAVAEPDSVKIPEAAPTFNLLIFWALTSLLAFSVAGEKMPWLTVHITLPMILLAGWGLGQVIERFDWLKFWSKGGLITVLLLAFFISTTSTLVSLTGAVPPFQGKSLEQLSATGMFLISLFLTIAVIVALLYLVSSWRPRDVLRLAVMVFFSLLAVQTIRTAVRAAYIHPDDATEYIVYAHGASGIKDVMTQVDTISNRTSGGQTLALAFDSSSPDQGVAWPFTWYLRHYTNKTAFTDINSSLQSASVILADQKNFELIKPVIGSDYYTIQYTRMVWPNQDYFNLTWDRVVGALTNPTMRAALWNIWLNRDYSLYAQVTGNQNMSVATWSPSDKMELLIRKDVAAQIWEYGIIQTAAVQPDPYAKGKLSLVADLTVGTSGTSNAQFNSPHGIAIAPDGSIYVADTNNNRVQHFSADGNFINAWGTFADISKGDAPIGTFNQPWDLAVSPDGKYVYVADTWNHRIQQFMSDGTPVKMWGQALYDPTNNNHFGIWGPRGIAVDSHGRVYVVDSGNKRILVYDADGNYITQIGNEGVAAGQFEEPVGIAVDAAGYVYVADTWNQRVQIFSPAPDGLTFSPSLQWDISGWFGESLDNKPYIAVDSQGHVFVTDPEGFRVIEFTTSGNFVSTWGDYGADNGSFGLAAGISVDSSGRVWVSDPVNNRLMRFALP